LTIADMNTIYVLDWYTNKYFGLPNVSYAELEQLSYNDKVSYYMDPGDSRSLSVWVYLWYDIEVEKMWQYDKKIEWANQEYFDKQLVFAKDKFDFFKTSFKKRFEWSKPITTRYHIFAHQLYCYFYAEERYIFGDYIRELRDYVWCNVFLFQVGARDMVRLSPSAKEYLTVDGRPLHAEMTRPLPSISMDVLSLQNLDGRDVERLKWWSGKLKESLTYETELYIEESKKYPRRGSTVKTKSWLIGTCLSFNIMSGDVNVKTKDGGFLRLPVDQLSVVKWAIHTDTDSDKRVKKLISKNK